MKIVQSFWSAGKNCRNGCFGWQSPAFHYLGWILSCNQLRKYYDDVTLITDESGYDILINQLRLPYTDIIVCLDELNNYNPNLWALAKIKAYSLMKEPFIHVDGDVFVWDKIDSCVNGHDLIVQNIETTSDYYRDMWKNILPAIDYMPNAMTKYEHGIGNKAYNMGIFGGNDIDFIHEYCSESFHFVNNNIGKVNYIDNINFNIFFEQVLLYELAYERHKDVVSYIHEDIGDNEYRGFADFDYVPDIRNYLHLLGAYKKMPMVCNKLRAFVVRYYPEYYCRLEKSLRLKPKLGDYGLEYTEESVMQAEAEYIDALTSKNAESYQDGKSLLLRDIISLGSERYLREKLNSNENVYIVPNSGYVVKDKCIEIKLLYGEVVKIPKLSIDVVIFDIINGKCSKNTFNSMAMTYLDEGFPEHQKDNYIELLWKRILLLTSYGIFVHVEK